MKRFCLFRGFLALALALGLSGIAAQPIQATASKAVDYIVVDANGDLPDANGTDCTCNNGGGACTLRAAIETANACSNGNHHIITFSTSFDSSIPIQLSTNLPPITRNNTTITGIDSSGGSPILRTIVIKRVPSSAAITGLTISGNYISVQRLTIQEFGTGILVSNGFNTIGVTDDGVNDADEGNTLILNVTGIHVDSGMTNQVAGNFIGVDRSGNLNGNIEDGIQVSTAFTIIGTDDDGNSDNLESNIISGNNDYGIYVTEDGDDITISGNTIGIKNKGGTVAIPNGLGGIYTSGSGGLIGSDGDNTSDNYQYNVISGNDGDGIKVYNSSGQIIAGNTIGLASNRSAKVANTGSGIYVDTTASNVTIGISGAPANPEGMRNYVSNNTQNGIGLFGSGCKVSGNTIGLSDPPTILDFGNGWAGIVASGSNHTIGTDGDEVNDALEGNIISGNDSSGIVLYGSGMVVAGNIIGLDGSGVDINGDLGNKPSGIHVSGGASGWRIGTDGDGDADALERNIISNSLYNGIFISDSADGTIAGNYIGTDISGAVEYGNGGSGIRIDPGNDGGIRIGGNIVGEGNLISGNTSSGINAEDSDNLTIAGNSIGVNAAGSAALPNNNSGIILTGCKAARIGTDGNGIGDANEKNLISGNGYYGIQIGGAESANTVIAGNWIGVAASGASALPNTQCGIAVWGGALNTRIGTDGSGSHDAAEGNLISGNSIHGILLYDQSGTVIAGNTIGLSADCSPCAKIPNNTGITIASGSKEAGTVGSVRIGTDGNGVADADEVNTISGNNQSGIRISAGDGHTIAGNLIGLDRNGAAQGNGGSGIQIESSAGSGTRIGTDGNGLNDSAERNILSANTNYGLVITNSGTTVAGNYIGTSQNGAENRGNASGGIFLNGSNNAIIGADSDGSSGEANEGNTISGNSGNGIYVSAGSGNRIAGNRIGVNAAGSAALPNAHAGIRLEFAVSGTVIGSNGDNISEALEGNIISGNAGYGINLAEATGLISNTRITGNTIGLGSNQETAIPNGSNGINLMNTYNTQIGLNASYQRNLISANGAHGIEILENHNEMKIVGNRIGVTASGQAAGNTYSGISISGTSKSAGQPAKTTPTTLVEANVLKNNGSPGIFVGASALAGHKFTNNIFHNNNGLAIDLDPVGVNANDPGDGDNGANLQQNHPLVETAELASPTLLHVTGSLNSMPSSPFTIEIYAVSSPDPSGYGEGLGRIHSFSATTDSSGNALFDVTFSYSLGTTRSYFSAIAISDDGSTSEFGPNLHQELEMNFLLIYLPLVSR